MGGGAAMRAAGKAASLSTLRGFVPEASLSGLASQAAFRSSGAEDSKLGVTTPPNANSDQSLQAVSVWDLEEWELEGEEFVTDKYSTIPTSPRLVFGPVPSIDEAKEATHDLKEALDKIYFSPLKSSENEGSNSGSQALLENQSCVSADASAIVSVPNQAYNAFKMLRENAAAQDVVASIASDPNVWTAVMNNQAFLEYCETEKSLTETMDTDSCEGSSTNDSNPAKPKKSSFVDFLENVTTAITGMLNNFSGFVQELFGGPDKKTEAGTTEGGSPGVMALGGSLMGLAVLVILVVSMKRA